jgi:UDP-2,3-diacylglucosamine pyrophosphatase LpxH
MMKIAKKVYVISDLHLGGAPPNPAATDEAEKRGFRMMKYPDRLAKFILALAEKPARDPSIELVINGDFVDFLAETHAGGQKWKPFLFDPKEALRTFNAVAERDEADGPVFDALAQLIERHRLTVLIGNHDLELSMPEVRQAFLRRIGSEDSGRVRFLYDGEALRVGSNAIIEHGNQYDPANLVNHDGLRHARALRSRGYVDEQVRFFEPPAGSKLVCEVMNPIKARYSFIDLLKPESEPLFALLLVLEPEAKKELQRLSKFLLETGRNALPKRGGSPQITNVSGQHGPTAQNDPLEEVIANALPETAQRAAVLAVAGPVQAGAGPTNISWQGWLSGKLGLARLLADNEWALLEERLPALRQTFRALEDDATWNEKTEPGKRYKKTAEELSEAGPGKAGFDFVVFGHTHSAKSVELDSGARYLNSGTWAQLMEFPKLPSDVAEADKKLRGFIDDLKANTLESYVKFDPRFVRLDVGEDDKVKAGELIAFDWNSGKVE